MNGNDDKSKAFDDALRDDRLLFALSRARSELRRAHFDERELAGHEEAVERDEQERDE